MTFIKFIDEFNNEFHVVDGYKIKRLIEDDTDFKLASKHILDFKKFILDDFIKDPLSWTKYTGIGSGHYEEVRLITKNNIIIATDGTTMPNSKIGIVQPVEIWFDFYEELVFKKHFKKYKRMVVDKTKHDKIKNAIAGKLF